MSAACASSAPTPADSKHGVFTKQAGTLSNDFFVNLLDMSTEWQPPNEQYVRKPSTGQYPPSPDVLLVDVRATDLGAALIGAGAIAARLVVAVVGSSSWRMWLLSVTHMPTYLWLAEIFVRCSLVSSAANGFPGIAVYAECEDCGYNNHRDAA